MRGKFLCFFLLFLIFLSMSVGVSAVSDTKTINVYNWGEFISDGTLGSLDVNAEFTKKTGIKVNYTTFQSNEEMFAKLYSGGADYDVIFPSDYMVGKLVDYGMLYKLDFNNIPNFSFIDGQLLNPEYDKNNEYSVPYVWGVVGIFYNKSKVSEPEEKINWDMLWDDKYSGQILMFDNPRDSLGISLIRNGKSVNSTSENDWREASDDLIQQKPLVQAYVMDQIFDKMGNGEAALAPYYSGDAAVLAQSNPDVGFVVPKEGTIKFVDAMCIPLSSRNKREAEAYINFMCETYVAKANIERVGYLTPHTEVYKQLDSKVSNDKNFYPDEELLENAQVFKNLPDDINKLIDSLWIQVKTGGNGSVCILISVFVGFILIYLFSVLYKRVSVKRNVGLKNMSCDDYEGQNLENGDK